jgi:hypothetical protein
VVTDRTPRGRFAVGNHAAVRKAKSAPGISGVSSFGGYVTSNENHSDLSGRAKWTTLLNAQNTPVIALGIRYFCGLLSGTTWSCVENEAGGKGARKGVEIVERGLLNAPLLKPWPMVIKKAALYRLLGFSIHACSMRRLPSGFIGYSEIAHRPQFTIEQWLRDDETKPFHTAVQRSPQSGKDFPIPLDESFYCVDDTLSDGPEGSGLLRHVIEYVRRLGIFEDLEGKAFVEDMGGMPLGRAPLSQIYDDTNGTADEKRAAVLAATSNIREIMEKRNKTPEEAMWMLLDSDTFRDQNDNPTAVAKWALEIVRTETANLPALDVTIRRVELQIARVLGIEWALMGADGAGSYAMHADKTSTFATMIQTTLNELGWFAMPLARRLIARNGLDPDTCTPTLVAEPISTEAVLTATQSLANLAMAGLRPDDPARNVIRQRLRLPDEPEPMLDLVSPRRTLDEATADEDPTGADGEEDVAEEQIDE